MDLEVAPAPKLMPSLIVPGLGSEYVKDRLGTYGKPRTNSSSSLLTFWLVRQALLLVRSHSR